MIIIIIQLKTNKAKDEDEDGDWDWDWDREEEKTTNKIHSLIHSFLGDSFGELQLCTPRQVQIFLWKKPKKKEKIGRNKII